MPTPKDQAYSVIFTAKLRQGAEKQVALKALNSTFKLEKPEIRQLISQAPSAIKSKLNKTQADKVVKLLWKAGWHSDLHLKGKVIYTTSKTDTAKVTKKVPAKSAPAAKKPQPKVSKGAGKVASPRKLELERLSCYGDKFSICTPKDWERMTYLNPNASLQMGCPKTESYMIVIEQSKVMLGGIMPLVNYSQAVTETAAKGIDQGIILSSPSTQKNRQGQEYMLSEMKGLISSTNVHYLISVSQSNESYFTTYFWCEEGRFEKRKKLFELLSGSFQIPA